MAADTRRKGDAWMLHRLLADLGVQNFQDEQDSVVTNDLKQLNDGRAIRTIQNIVRPEITLAI